MGLLTLLAFVDLNFGLCLCFCRSIKLGHVIRRYGPEPNPMCFNGPFLYSLSYNYGFLGYVSHQNLSPIQSHHALLFPESICLWLMPLGDNKIESNQE